MCKKQGNGGMVVVVVVVQVQEGPLAKLDSFSAQGSLGGEGGPDYHGRM